MIDQKILDKIFEIALDNTTINSCNKVEGITKSVLQLDYSKEQLEYIFKQLLESELFEKVAFNCFALSSFGYSIKNEFRSFKQYKQSLSNQNNVISYNINGKIINSPIIQDSNLLDVQFHQKEEKYPNRQETISQNKSSIFQRIRDITNHQVIGGLIVAGLLAIMTWFFNMK